MAGSKFAYDENGTFFYFLLAFEALVLLPSTYYCYPRNDNNRSETKDKNLCSCDNCCIKSSRLRSIEPWRKAKRRFIKCILIVGWIILMLTVYKVAHLQHDYIAYDPYEILEISQSATVADIKKAYRRLSLIYHPDREKTGDEKKFLVIAKAYAALTNEEARKNWENFGSPDGPGAINFGIALPKFIIEKENSMLVLGLYALVFMVALPLGVGIWWYRSIQYGGEEVLLGTTQHFLKFIFHNPNMVFKRVIMILAASYEFFKFYNPEIIERPSDNFEVPQLIKELATIGEKNKVEPLCYLYSLKARALIHAHLRRMKLPPNTLEEDKMYIIKKCPNLLVEFVQCASNMTLLALAKRIPRSPSLDTIENAMRLCACIVQALNENKSAFLQLPHISEEMLRHLTGKKRNIRSLRSLASMKPVERRAMLRSLTDEEYSNLVKVLQRMPLLELDLRTEVVDDEDCTTITCGARVTLTAVLIRKDMGALFTEEDITHEHPEIEEDTENRFDDESRSLVCIPNGSADPKKRVWEKNKKKGRGGRQKKKPRPQTMVVKKEVLKKPPVKPQKKESGDSDTDSDSDSDKKSGSDKEENTEGGREEGGDSESDKMQEDDLAWNRFQEKVSKKRDKASTKSKESHPVHCPYFPDVKHEYWWVYLCDKKKHSLMTIPYLVTNLVTVEEVDLIFTAPVKPGVYTYTACVRSDSYIDFDIVKTLKLDVKEPKPVDLTKWKWDDVSEEEEEEKEESAVEDSDLATDTDSDDD